MDHRDFYKIKLRDKILKTNKRKEQTKNSSMGLSFWTPTTGTKSFTLRYLDASYDHWPYYINEVLPD